MFRNLSNETKANLVMMEEVSTPFTRGCFNEIKLKIFISNRFKFSSNSFVSFITLWSLFLRPGHQILTIRNFFLWLKAALRQFI